MRFWTREILGWLLVLLGLFCIFQTYAFLAEGKVVEAMIYTAPSIFVFRGGIHLLKVAVAAQVSLRSQEQVVAKRPAGAKASLVRE